jgi:hypothetical protein
MHDLNYIAVLVAAAVIFLIGGLWYSPVMFAKKWVALQNKDIDSMKQGGTASGFLQVFICGLVTSWVLAILLHWTRQTGWMYGTHLAVLAWLGLTAATSYGTALFSQKPKALWAIDTGFNLVSMAAAGAILGAWQ